MQPSHLFFISALFIAPLSCAPPGGRPPSSPPEPAKPANPIDTGTGTFGKPRTATKAPALGPQQPKPETGEGSDEN